MKLNELLENTTCSLLYTQAKANWIMSLSDWTSNFFLTVLWYIFLCITDLGPHSSLWPVHSLGNLILQSNEMRLQLSLVVSDQTERANKLKSYFSATPFYITLLYYVCRHLSRPPSVPLHLSLCCLSLFPSLWLKPQKIKACMGGACHLVWAGTQEYREKTARAGDKGKREKDCHIDLVLLPAVVGEKEGRGVC